MITLAVGYEKIKLQWESKYQYLAEDIFARMQKRKKTPVWLHVDGNDYKLEHEHALMLACQIVVDYHNTFFYNPLHNNNEWIAETQEMEEKAQHFMEEDSDSNADDYEYSVLEDD